MVAAHSSLLLHLQSACPCVASTVRRAVSDSIRQRIEEGLRVYDAAGAECSSCCTCRPRFQVQTVVYTLRFEARCFGQDRLMNVMMLLAQRAAHEHKRPAACLHTRDGRPAELEQCVPQSTTPQQKVKHPAPRAVHQPGSLVQQYRQYSTLQAVQHRQYMQYSRHPPRSAGSTGRGR